MPDNSQANDHDTDESRSEQSSSSASTCRSGEAGRDWLEREQASCQTFGSFCGRILRGVRLSLAEDA